MSVEIESVEREFREGDLFTDGSKIIWIAVNAKLSGSGWIGTQIVHWQVVYDRNNPNYSYGISSLAASKFIILGNIHDVINAGNFWRQEYTKNPIS